MIVNRKNVFLSIPLKIFRFGNLLSFDVALGTIAMGLLAVEVLDCKLVLAWWLILPVVVWLIYTADHLSDAIKSKNVKASSRHIFHLKYLYLLATLSVVVACVVAICAYLYLPQNIFFGGCLISFSTFIYLLYSRLSHDQPLPKEIFIAILYTIGIWFAPILAASSFPWWAIFPVLLTFITAFNNLLLFSIFGNIEDVRSNFISISTTFGLKISCKIFNICLIFACGISVLFGILLFNQIKILVVALIFLTINLTLWYIIKHKGIFAKNDNYRLLGDVLFILPLVLKLF